MGGHFADISTRPGDSDMTRRHSRRSFLRNATIGTTLAAAGGKLLSAQGHAAVAGDRASASQSDLMKLVALLEDTPRQQLVDRLAARVHGGMQYADLLGALLVAGVRNVEPRPSVGFKFHAVLVVQSVHLAAMAARPADRWLPLFWSADYFKDAEAQDERERGWTMPPVDEPAVPSADKALPMFNAAMDRWDEAKADAATAGLSRHVSPDAIWEAFFRYGARDYRSIGHKAIDVANSHRVLKLIGWKHAEPVLRSLSYALLMHEDGNPADRDAAADRPWRQNQKRVQQIPDGWKKGRMDQAATWELVATLRDGSPDDASEAVVQLLNNGVGPQSIWDALMLAAVELVNRQPAIVALHSVTTTNALLYAYRFANDDETRRLILLQNAAFLPMFRESMRGRGRVKQFAIDSLQPRELSQPVTAAIDDVFADVGRTSQSAAEKTCGLLAARQAWQLWDDRAIDLLISKGRGAHDYKFACAVLEDAEFLSSEHRGRYLGGSVHFLKGSTNPNNGLIDQAREALGRREG
jgi:hypothetical protein